MWRAEVKCRALGALQYLLQSPRFAKQCILQNLLPVLTRTALTPVYLRQFVSMFTLERRWLSAQQVWCIVYGCKACVIVPGQV